VSVHRNVHAFSQDFRCGFQVYKHRNVLFLRSFNFHISFMIDIRIQPLSTVEDGYPFCGVQSPRIMSSNPLVSMTRRPGRINRTLLLVDKFKVDTEKKLNACQEPDKRTKQSPTARKKLYLDFCRCGVVE